MTNPIRQAVEALKHLNKIMEDLPRDYMGYTQTSSGEWYPLFDEFRHTSVSAHTRLAKFAPLIEELMDTMIHANKHGQHITPHKTVEALLDAGWDDARDL